MMQIKAISEMKLPLLENTIHCVAKESCNSPFLFVILGLILFQTCMFDILVLVTKSGQISYTQLFSHLFRKSEEKFLFFLKTVF